jgi:DNA polymerase I-like protein with 3'-5' exonuclease and polymerase domains
MGDAKKLMELYHKANPNLRMWYQQIQEELKRSRTLVNLLGRKHRFLDRWGDSLFRSAYSYIPQSTVGDLLNLALLKIYHGQKDLPFEISILLQLHDAVYVMTREENVMDLIKYLRSNMLIPLKCNNLEFMIDVDFKVGDSWGESEDVEINWREKDV